MNGKRISTTLAIGANQNKHACSELSCCAVNGPRALALPADWAIMALGTASGVPGFAINLFSSGQFDMPESSQIQGKVSFVLTTEYPVGDGSISITVRRTGGGCSDTDAATNVFSLWVRIPCWSERNTIMLNGAAKKSNIASGQYFKLSRAWQDNDCVQVQLDFRLRCWLQPLAACSSDGAGAVADAAEEQPDGQLRAQTAAITTPAPFWTSASALWPSNTMKFDSDSGPVIIPASATGGAIGAAPTTACGWISADWAVSSGECIPFSFGCDRTHADFARAIGVTQTQANYYAYEGVQGGHADLPSLVDRDSMSAWWTALHDSGHWHHLCKSFCIPSKC